MRDIANKLLSKYRKERKPNVIMPFRRRLLLFWSSLDFSIPWNVIVVDSKLFVVDTTIKEDKKYVNEDIELNILCHPHCSCYNNLVSIPVFWPSQDFSLPENVIVVDRKLSLLLLIASYSKRRVLIPFPRKLFFSNPSSNPTIPACVARIEIPFPFFYCFFFHESQSQCTKSHFPASKKGKSQLPFYPFTTL